MVLSILCSKYSGCTSIRGLKLKAGLTWPGKRLTAAETGGLQLFIMRWFLRLEFKGVDTPLNSSLKDKINCCMQDVFHSTLPESTRNGYVFQVTAWAHGIEGT